MRLRVSYELVILVEMCEYYLFTYTVTLKQITTLESVPNESKKSSMGGAPSKNPKASGVSEIIWKEKRQSR